MPAIDGPTLRTWRRSRGWDVPEMARQLRRAARGAGQPVAAQAGLVRMIYSWERGAHQLTERYELLYAAAVGITPERLAGTPGGITPDEMGVSPDNNMTTGTVVDGLNAGQVEELLVLLDEQWHALVRTDNLLGPRHALGGVREQLGVIEALLRTVRPPVRQDVLRLGARYAESAAWLHEDSADMTGAGYWTGRAMEWALEAGDPLMTSWALFRRGEHAVASGDAASVVGLAGAARREGGELPGRMLAAITLQEARAHALDKAEADCNRALDQARELAAMPDDPGDASKGHGSYCVPAYVEMHRGRCLLRLGRPREALAAFNHAIVSLPPVYRRDRGVAFSGKATALAALDEHHEAATAAVEALGIGRHSGSERIVRMVMPVVQALAPHESLTPVAQLRALLGDRQGASGE